MGFWAKKVNTGIWAIFPLGQLQKEVILEAREPLYSPLGGEKGHVCRCFILVPFPAPTPTHCPHRPVFQVAQTAVRASRYEGFRGPLGSESSQSRALGGLVCS